jgi:GH35 family endo-1,4-beta-xylanase
MFKLAHKADPEARLYLNDFSILNGNSLVKYGEQIESLVKSGAPVRGIGCQGHFGAKLPPMNNIRMNLDWLATFRLPILITEFDINTKDEEAKAKQLEDFYRLCFSHPAVEGILMWGFWAGSHWRPDAALFSRDFSPRPAALAYRRLIFEEWWSKEEGKTGKNGEISTRVFFGNYTVTAEANGKKSVTELSFPKSLKELPATVVLK